MAVISIITPVYKVENYIGRCIDSVLNQTYNEWELILVDDGSPDKSGLICDEYAKRDSRIKVFHKTNGGVSSARNLALEHVTGDYITFLDSDDWISSECVSICLDEITQNNIDILQFGFHKINKNGINHYTRMLGSEALSIDDYVQYNRFSLCAAGSMIKSCIIQNNCIKFIEGIKYAEDQLFLYNCMLFATRIKSIPQCFYYYFENESSATSVKQKSDDLIASIEQLSKMPYLKSVYRKPVQIQIQIFLQRILINFDLTRDAYMNLFKTYYEIDCPIMGSLKCFLKIAKISTFIAYDVYGRIYSLYNKSIR